MEEIDPAKTSLSQAGTPEEALQCDDELLEALRKAVAEVDALDEVVGPREESWETADVAAELDEVVELQKETREAVAAAAGLDEGVEDAVSEAEARERLDRDREVWEGVDVYPEEEEREEPRLQRPQWLSKRA